jgi:hypothetical protein
LDDSVDDPPKTKRLNRIGDKEGEEREEDERAIKPVSRSTRT